MQRSIVFMWSVAIMALGTGTASAQNYPTKPVRMVAAEPGGGGDFVARQIAQGLSVSLGHQVIVDNRGGANGAIAGQTVAKAAPDGYTLILYSSSFWIGPLMRNAPYDPVSDFSPITLVSTQPNVLVAHPSVAADSVVKLIALAKAKPGELNYASGGTGSTSHLAVELFKTMAGVNLVHVPYKGSASALNDLLGGQVHLTLLSATSTLPHLKSGRLKALAVTSAKPSALFPGLPTVAASGVPGYESVLMYGVFAPARTPTAVIDRLNGEIVRIVQRPDVKEKLFNAGAEVVGSSPQELGNTVKSEMARLSKVIKANGLREE